MAVRGYLPKFLGGEMVYDAVVRVNCFGPTQLLMDYLMEQLTAAARRQLPDAHYAAIGALLDRICHLAKESSKL